MGVSWYMKSDERTRDIPKMIYGTAWKEDATENHVCTAIQMGFRGIDTANQRRHYNEAAVGSAIFEVLKSCAKRKDFFIQTKYTYASGQDHRMPYDIRADYGTQLRQSFQSSLDHLQTNYIDSYILHGPSVRNGLTQDDWQVWQEMEAIHKEGKIIYLGVSNVSIEQLKTLFEGATVKPAFVQNRCFAKLGWDKDVREFCKENGIIYQGFSLLTANPFVLSEVKQIAEEVNKTPAQVLFRFSMHIGILPLTGTTSQTHMREDLELDFSLNEEDVRFIENIAVT
jgi:diketogulonate reductase-like aldo/keto reductase